MGFFDFASKTLKWSPLPDPIKFLGPETDSPGSDPEIQHLHPMNSKRLSSVPSYKLCLVSHQCLSDSLRSLLPSTLTKPLFPVVT